MPASGPSAQPDDGVCKRSTDSLASEIGDLLPARVLNLACPDATVTAGLRGPQDIGGQQVPAQVGVLRQVQGLRFVVVEIGPNDVGWTDFLRYCYGVPDCADTLTQNEFDYRLAAFDRSYGDLLVDLNDLPGRPQVIVVTSYAPSRRTPTAPTPRPRATPAWTRRRSPCSRRATISSTRSSPREPRSTASRSPAPSSRCCATRIPTGSARTYRAWPIPSRSTPPASARCAPRRRWSGWSTRRRSGKTGDRVPGPARRSRPVHRGGRDLAPPGADRAARRRRRPRGSDPRAVWSRRRPTPRASSASGPACRCARPGPLPRGRVPPGRQPGVRGGVGRGHGRAAGLRRRPSSR